MKVEYEGMTRGCGRKKAGPLGMEGLTVRDLTVTTSNMMIKKTGMTASMRG